MPSVSCYNRGCGKDFDPENNEEDSCCHHPGLPFFHDVYKGWSCCNKKCIDFTEFLNIKGCKMSKHSNEKPPEPPKPKVDKETTNTPIEVNYPKPKTNISIKRPPFNSMFTTLVPKLAPSLMQKVDENVCKNDNHCDELDSNEIVVGTKCKHGGCKGEYGGPQSDSEECVHHPGVPVFHEGLKYWSCCQKKTTDFSTFLNQVGCTNGVHIWKNEATPSNVVKCRWDWHQTGNYVVVAIYAKDYDPKKSVVKINPIRLYVDLEFPKENGARFNMDIELRGVIDINDSSVQMFGTKVEVSLRKAELGLWSLLDFPKPVEAKPDVKADTNHVASAPNADEEDDGVDLDDVEPVPQIGRVNISEVDEEE